MLSLFRRSPSAKSLLAQLVLPDDSHGPLLIEIQSCLSRPAFAESKHVHLILTLLISSLNYFTRLTVAIVGDILHSRVARSLIHGLTTLGAPEVRVIGPQTLLPSGVEALGVASCSTTCAPG